MSNGLGELLDPRSFWSAKRLSALMGMTPWTVAGDRFNDTCNRCQGGFAFILTSSLRVSPCAYCNAMRVGANFQMVSIGAWESWANGGEVDSLWPYDG